MTTLEEIEQIKSELAHTDNEQAEAELILRLLKKYNSINGASSKTYIDRLLQLAEKMNSVSYKAWGLYQLAAFYYLTGEYIISISISRQAILLFEEIQDMKGVASAYNNIGMNNYKQCNYPEALKNHSQSLQIKEKLKDKPGIANSHINIGNIYSDQGNYPEALKSFLQTLLIKEEMGDLVGMAVSLNNIGIIYMRQGNYDEALKNYSKTLKISEQAAFKQGIAVSYNNFGVICQYQDNYPEALKNYLEGLQLREEIDDKSGIAESCINLAVVYENQGNYPEALKNLLRARQIASEIGDKQVVANSYNVVADVQKKQGEPAESLKSKLLALQLFEEISEKDRIKEVCLSLFNTFKDNRDFENALKYYEEYHRAESELLGEQAQKQLTNLNFQHNMEQKEKDAEIARLKNVELKEALEKLKLEKSRSEQLFQNQLQELKSSALQAQMNPHFVFNSLNAIQQYIWEKDPEEATAYLSRFSKLIRSVLDNSRRQFVTLEQDLTALEYYIELESLRFENKFAHQIVCDSSLDKAGIQLPPMIIQPFVENAIIHGLQPRKSSGKLTITLQRKEDDILHIIIEDNGVGRVKANQANSGKVRSHQSVAIQLTKERLEKMNGGKLNHDAIIISDLYDENRNPAGTKVEINVPVEYP